MAHPYWPLFDLSICTPRLELRYPDDALVRELIELAQQGIHDPASMPFGVPWTDAPSPQFERSSLQHYWGGRANHTAERWDLHFAVLVEGRAVGTQSAHAANFGKLRQAETGSWLGQAFQGQGLGKEMRAAVIHFLFDGLGAQRCISGAWHDNAPSLGVSRSLGYVDNGEEFRLRRGKPDRLIHLLLSREAWEPQRRDDIEIVNLEPCMELLVASAE
jgi:RimJ/RimL family protein N-acetyltransferase